MPDCREHDSLDQHASGCSACQAASRAELLAALHAAQKSLAMHAVHGFHCTWLHKTGPDACSCGLLDVCRQLGTTIARSTVTR